MGTPLQSTQPTRSKDLEETRRKDTNPITRHTIGWQDHHDHLFCDCEGVLLVDFLSRGTTVNSPYNASLFHRSGSSLREKRRWKLKHDVLLLHDNGSVHKSNIIQSAIQYTGFIELSHLACSADLAPNDYHLFSNVKNFLRGKDFETDDEAIMTVNHYFES